MLGKTNDLFRFSTKYLMLLSGAREVGSPTIPPNLQPANGPSEKMARFWKPFSLWYWISSKVFKL